MACKATYWESEGWGGGGGFHSGYYLLIMVAQRLWRKKILVCNRQGCESSDFNMISDFLLFTKPQFQTLKSHGRDLRLHPYAAD